MSSPRARSRTDDTAKLNVCDVPLCCKFPISIPKCYERDHAIYRYRIMDENNSLGPSMARCRTELVPAEEKWIKQLATATQKRKPYCTSFIRDRALNMPNLAVVSHKQMFIILSIILNLSLVNMQKQYDVMDLLRKRGLLTKPLLQLLHIISHHPNTGLTELQRRHFHFVCKELLKNCPDNWRCDLNYFSPDDIVGKPMTTFIDPYELEYLRSIFQSQESFSSSKFMYIFTLVERLQELGIKERDCRLKLLYENGALPRSNLKFLLKFLRTFNFKIDSKKLRKLFFTLVELLAFEPHDKVPEEQDSEEEVDILDISKNKYLQDMIDRKAAEKAYQEKLAKETQRASEVAAKMAASEESKSQLSVVAKKEEEEAAAAKAKKLAEEKALEKKFMEAQKQLKGTAKQAVEIVDEPAKEKKPKNSKRKKADKKSEKKNKKKPKAKKGKKK